MSKSFEQTVGLMQLLLLGLWEGIGALYFGWSPVAIALCWFGGIFTFNIGIATALRTFIKLTRVPETATNIVNVHGEAQITEEDGVG